MKLEDLVDKAGYCLRMMRLARWLATEIPDDHRRRVVGRMVLVYLPLYVDLAFALIRRPGLSPRQVGELRTGVRRVRDDYQAYYSRIRNDLGAHRDDVELDELIDAWNEIDSDTLDWFTTAAEESFARIVAAHPGLQGALEPMDAEGDQEIAARLRASAPPGGEGLRFSTDALALTRGETTMIPAHPVQTRVSVLVSVLDTLEQTVGLLNEIGDLGCHFLLKSMLVMDAVNLVEGVYGADADGAERRSPCLLEILEEGDFAGRAILRASVATIDRETLERTRSVRNRACAHLDDELTLREIFDALGDLDINEMIERVINPTWQAVGEACAADQTTSWLMLNGATLKGLSAADTPGVRAFDRNPRPSG